MKIISLLLALTLIVGCSKEEKEATVPPPRVDVVLPLTDAIKYYQAGDVIITDPIYTPQGISYGELLKNKKITKTIKLQNSPLFQDYATSIRIEELEPKIFSIDSHDCSIVKTGQSCLITISANYTDELFTSTKTARLVLGKVENLDLFVELFGQIRNVNITSAQYVSTYSVSMDKNFSTDFAQYTIQQRSVFVHNNDPTRYLRNDYIVPQLVGQNPTDYYISSNECMYPVAPNSSCEIRVLFKKWKTQSSPPDTEIKFPNLSQNYSLKYGQYVTYAPIFSTWGNCSTQAVCTGVGTQVRTITGCIKNGVDNVATSNCSGNLIQSCESPSGNRTINIAGGTMFQTCSQGATSWASQSVDCAEDYHDSGGLSCVPNVYIPTVSDYDPITNPLTVVCSGTVVGTRDIISCLRQDTGTIVDNSKCIDPAPTITYKSPQGTRNISAPSGHGTLSQSCLEGSSNWITTSVICEDDYHRSGNDCVANVYIPTYSAYTTSPVQTTTCSGTDTITRTITSCKTQHDNQSVSLLKCTDPEPSKTVQSPAGYRNINLTDPNTNQVMGSQQQFCLAGSTTWNAVNTSCYQYYSNMGDTCQANNIGSPSVSDASNKYRPNNTYSFDVIADVNTNVLRIYSDASCSTLIGNGIATGGSLWNTSATFPLNILRGVYAKAVNTTTLKESLCTYLFSYMYDNIPPTATMEVNDGRPSSTYATLKIDLPSVADNSGILTKVLVYEDNTCSDLKNQFSYSDDPINYIPTISGTNLSIGVKVEDAAGNQSACLTQDIFFGLQVEPLYTSSPNWNQYYKVGSGTPGVACDGSENINSATPLCIHGGDKKIVRLDQESCDGLSLDDALGIFNWECKIDGLGKAYFFSNGMKDNVGIRNLINDEPTLVPAWIPNKVSMMSQEGIIGSAETAWYSNPLEYLVLDENTTTNLSTPGLRVIRKPDPEIGTHLEKTRGIYITTNNVGIIAMMSVFVKKIGTTNNCGTNGLVGADFPCLVAVGASSGSRSFIYLEGMFTGATTDPTDIIPDYTNSPTNVYLSTVGYSMINNSFFRNGNVGLRLRQSSNNLIVNSGAIGNAGGNGRGIVLNSTSNYNKLSGLHLFFNQTGLDLNNANFNILSKINTDSNSVYGITMTSSNSNILSEINSSNNQNHNITITTSNSNKISQVNTTSSGGYGFYLNGSDLNKITLLNAINNTSDGIRINNSNSNILLNTIVANTANGVGLSLVSGNSRNLIGQIRSFSNFVGILSNGQNKGTGNILIQDTVSALVQGDNTTINSLAEPTGLSDFIKIEANPDPVPLEQTFAGNVNLGDEWSPLTEFSYTDPDPVVKTKYLSSVAKAGNFDSGMTGPCLSGMCQIFDYSLSIFDQAFYGKSNDGLLANSLSVVIENDPCPIEVGGDISLTNGACVIGGAWNTTHKTQNACEGNGGTWSGLDGTPASPTTARRFLKNAIEVIDPASPAYIAGGNHDGLCEAGESCVYTPNFGAYQGHDRLVRCTYNSKGTTLTNIAIWGFSINGKMPAGP